MKRLTSWLIAFMLLVGAMPGLAARGDADPIRNDGYEIASAVAIGDTVYLLGVASGFWRYRVGDIAPAEVELSGTENGDWPRFLVGGGDALYALCETHNGLGGQLMRIVFVDDSRAQLTDPIPLNWSVMSDGLDFRPVRTAVMMDGKLYLLALDWGRTRYSMIVYDLHTGEAVEHFIRDLQGMTAYRDGQLLVKLRDEHHWDAPVRVGVFDPATAAVTESDAFADEAGGLRGLAYDEATDTLYYVSEYNVYACKGLDNSAAIYVNDVPDQYDLDRNGGMLLTGGFYALCGYDALTVRNVNLDDRPTRTLTVSGFVPTDVYYAFRAAYPDVALVAGDARSDEDIIRALISRDGSVDVYEVWLDGPAYSALRERGYAVKLTGDPVVERTGRMYATVRDVLTQDGAVIAVPTFSGGSASFYCNSERLNELGLSEADLPRTWSEFIDFVEHWDDTYGREHPDITPLFNGFGGACALEYLAGQLIDDYMWWMNREGAEHRFDVPVLRDLLARLSAARLPGDWDPDLDFRYSYESLNAALFHPWGRMGFDSGGLDAFPLPLALSDDMQPAVGVSILGYVINPFSANQDIAQAFLNVCASDMPSDVKGNLCPDENEPVRWPDYAKSRADTIRFIEDVQGMIETAADVDKPSYIGLLGALEAQLDELDHKWKTTADDIARYRELDEYLVAVTFSIDRANAPEFSTLFERYVAGQIDAGQLLEGFDQRVHMMTMEGY